MATRKRKQSKPKPATVKRDGCGPWHELHLYGERIPWSFYRFDAVWLASAINRILAKREKELGRG